MNAAQLPEQYATRPGTPMVGPYSTNQMDDFYQALGRGEAKPSGLMNLLQHLIVTEQCAPNSRVLDVCCGRGLALPLLYRYAPTIEGYVGLDISADNLDEARERIEALRATYGDPFPVDLVECDVAQPWPALPSFDIALYTSALEHLPFELGVRSLRAPAGRGAVVVEAIRDDPERRSTFSRPAGQCGGAGLPGGFPGIGSAPPQPAREAE